jgi:hypothetical protein
MDEWSEQVDPCGRPGGTRPRRVRGGGRELSHSDDIRARDGHPKLIAIGGSDCSAAASSVILEPQPGLPDPVEDVRQAIAEAAVRCDYGRLAALAREGGKQFTFTFGDADDPAQYWRREEAIGGEPMKFLAGMLDRPYGKVSAWDLILYVWPSAATYPSWAEVPPEARNALRPLYEDQDFQQFAQFGSYIGYRVGTTETGDWLYFVAGD